MSYKRMTTNKLISLLGKLTASTTSQIKKMACILVELNSRGEGHPLMKEGALRHYAAIASGKLSPLAVLNFAHATIVRELVGLPMDEQERISRGGTITVAEYDNKGKIVSVDRPLLELPIRAIRIAINSGKMVPFEQQRKAITSRPAIATDVRTESKVVLRADKASGEILVGTIRFPPIALNDVLFELGFEPIKRRVKNAA